uniref:Rho guanine nucleotide exchange factor 10 n=1 Tax=Sphaerodactylus townsendi TaxID=933632 RepID=A0ACB8GD34_9SAUR
MGPGQLYHDLQNLLHDLNVVGQISQLIGSLKGHYQNLNQSVAHDWSSGLQKLILKKEDEIRAADRCRIQLQLPGKPDKSGRPTFFTAVFNTFTPAIKQSWINNLQMAKLALVEENMLGWFCIEDDGNQIKKEKHPLLVKHMPVMMAKQQEFKVECAAYNPEPYSCEESDPDSLSIEHGFLWIGSCTNQMGQIAIVSFQNSSPKVIECFNVESRILCMVYIPEVEKCKGLEVPSDLEDVPTKPPSVPTVCLGTEEGSISVYKSSQGSKKVRLQHFFTPEKSTVMSLAYKSSCLFVGLVNGNIVIYTKSEEIASPTKDMLCQQASQLGKMPVGLQQDLALIESIQESASLKEPSQLSAALTFLERVRSGRQLFKDVQGEGPVSSPIQDKYPLGQGACQSPRLDWLSPELALGKNMKGMPRSSQEERAGPIQRYQETGKWLSRGEIGW